MIGLAPSFSITNQSRTEAATQSTQAIAMAAGNEPVSTMPRIVAHAPMIITPLEAQVPDARTLRDDACHGDVDQRGARAQDRHHQLVKLGHVGSLAARRRRSSNPDFAVIKSATEALKISMAAAGRPARIGR